MTDVPGLILAGGRSSRMGGGDKCLSPLHGRPLLSHILDRIQPQTSRLLINSNSDRTLFGNFGLPVWPDTLPDHPGPLAGILTGLLWAREHGATHLATVPCDTPFLPHDLVPRLKQGLCRSRAGIVVARDPARIHPIIALWPVGLAPQLAADLHAGAGSVFRWLDQFAFCSVEFPADHFMNLNTPAELLAAERASSLAA